MRQLFGTQWPTPFFPPAFCCGCRGLVFLRGFPGSISLERVRKIKPDVPGGTDHGDSSPTRMGTINGLFDKFEGKIRQESMVFTIKEMRFVLHVP